MLQHLYDYSFYIFSTHKLNSVVRLAYQIELFHSLNHSWWLSRTPHPPRCQPRSRSCGFWRSHCRPICCPKNLRRSRSDWCARPSSHQCKFVCPSQASERNASPRVCWLSVPRRAKKAYRNLENFLTSKPISLNTWQYDHWP